MQHESFRPSPGWRSRLVWVLISIGLVCGATYLLTRNPDDHRACNFSAETQSCTWAGK